MPQFSVTYRLDCGTTLDFLQMLDSFSIPVLTLLNTAKDLPICSYLLGINDQALIEFLNQEKGR